MDFEFKAPSTIPQDLLLIQDLIGILPPPVATAHHASDSLESSDDSIASSDDEEVESEDEVEADLAPHDEDSGLSAASPDSASHSDSESDTSSSDASEIGCETPQRRKPMDDVEDEESGMTTTANYLQTKNEITDAEVMIPSISEVDPYDVLEKVGEIMSIVGNIVIVRGLTMDHIKPLSEHVLDAESLLVFEDRKVLGYIHETFGPTSRPLYQVKFNQQHPLDTDQVWLSREVFHVPQRSNFVFVNQLRILRGSDASNIHDEEPAEDDVEFSDDEEEAAFKAQRKRRRGHSLSSSRQSTPASSRVHIPEDTYHGSNPYDAYGPYDDDYHVTGPSRPSPIPYDDPYADVPASDVQAHPTGMEGRAGWAESAKVEGPKMSRGHVLGRGSRGRGARNRRSWNPLGRGHPLNPISPRRTFDSDSGRPFTETPWMGECLTGYNYTGEGMSPQPFVQPLPNTWTSPEANIPEFPQQFVQPHINPRFASVFGLNLPSEWTPQDASSHMPRPQHRAGTWTMHGGAESGRDTYNPM